MIACLNVLRSNIGFMLGLLNNRSAKVLTLSFPVLMWFSIDRREIQRLAESRAMSWNGGHALSIIMSFSRFRQCERFDPIPSRIALADINCGRKSQSLKSIGEVAGSACGSR